jgi:hypothetical protein
MVEKIRTAHDPRSHMRTRSAAAVAGIVIAIAVGSASPASAAYFSPSQRIYTLAQQPQCVGGTVDVTVFRSELFPTELKADFKTNLYNPAWSGSASYECFVTIEAAWRNNLTGASGLVAHDVASWRFQGPNVADPYVYLDTGAGPVTVTFTTTTAHTPSARFEVPAT